MIYLLRCGIKNEKNIYIFESEWERKEILFFREIALAVGFFFGIAVWSFYINLDFIIIHLCSQ